MKLALLTLLGIGALLLLTRPRKQAYKQIPAPPDDGLLDGPTFDSAWWNRQFEVAA